MKGSPDKRRSSLRQLVLAGLLLSAGPGSAQAAQEVHALRYGVTLFHFFQQDYFSALTELMAAQQLQQLDVHTDRAELLRGGMSLSYGMDRVAGKIFQDLLSRSEDTVDRDQAWFYLAKMAWQRGEAERARLALAQLSTDYAGALAPEADYLRAAIALRQADEQLAGSYIERLPRDSAWRYYLYYNMGASRAAGGDWQSSIQYFHEFDDMPLRTAESKALRDKALTASGFAQMAAGEFQQARGDFTRVRLDGPLSERALLGYGWASAEMGDYRAALSPWQALSERSLLNESARESLLAMSYAYEQLGRHSIAMSHYRKASDVYAAGLDDLQAAIEAFRSGDLQALLGTDGEERGGWLLGADILPQGEYAPYLRHLVTRHGFQVALRELRDLHQLAGHLAAAGERLQVLVQVDAQQQRTWSTVVAGDRRQQLQRSQLALRGQIDGLRRRLDQATAQGDARLLADEQQSARWRRLDRAAALAARLDVGASQQEQLQRYRGLMIWEDSENYPVRVWQAQRQVQELEALAAHSLAGLEAVDQAIAQRRQSGFAPRIEALQVRVRAQSRSVQRAIGVSQARVRQLAVAELEHEADQLSRALGQSRLAIARLYDLGSTEIPR